jgi:hypothetical protein
MALRMTRSLGITALSASFLGFAESKEVRNLPAGGDESL